MQKWKLSYTFDYFLMRDFLMKKYHLLIFNEKYFFLQKMFAKKVILTIDWTKNTLIFFAIRLVIKIYFHFIVTSNFLIAKTNNIFKVWNSTVWLFPEILIWRLFQFLTFFIFFCIRIIWLWNKTKKFFLRK